MNGRKPISRTTVDLSEIISGGSPKDGLPSIDHRTFGPVAEVDDLAAREPVVSLVLDDDARPYPLRVMMWPEIVNDMVAGTPVTVTYCPLCPRRSSEHGWRLH